MSTSLSLRGDSGNECKVCQREDGLTLRAVKMRSEKSGHRRDIRAAECRLSIASDCGGEQEGGAAATTAGKIEEKNR